MVNTFCFNLDHSFLTYLKAFKYYDAEIIVVKQGDEALDQYLGTGISSTQNKHVLICMKHSFEV